MRIFALVWIAGVLCVLRGGTVLGQQAEQQPESALQRTEAAAQGDYVVDRGSKIPLNLMNTLSSKQAAEGGRVYLETMFPVLVNGR